MAAVVTKRWYSQISATTSLDSETVSSGQVSRTMRPASCSCAGLR
ncbi:hypothetical protein [Bosea thiooxidans]